MVRKAVYVRGSVISSMSAGPAYGALHHDLCYAMVLENGTHASLDQPMARAIVSTPAG